MESENVLFFVVDNISITVDTETTDVENFYPEVDEEDSIVKLELTETPSTQIPLQRIAMSVRNRRARGSKILKSAWMIHFTESDKTVRT